jgi:hypothetical protein
MADRSRIRVGRGCAYFLTDADASGFGVNEGSVSLAVVGTVHADDTLDIRTIDPDGGATPRSNVAVGIGKGQCSMHWGVAGKRP